MIDAATGQLFAWLGFALLLALALRPLVHAGIAAWRAHRAEQTRIRTWVEEVRAEQEIRFRRWSAAKASGATATPRSWRSR